MKQQELEINDKKLPRKGSLARKLVTTTMYGGDIRYRKLQRPLSNSKTIHTVFKMTDIAYKKSGGFRKETSNINQRLFKLSQKFNIKIYRHSINSNHIHLVCKLTEHGPKTDHLDGYSLGRKNFSGFLRAFSGSVGLYYKLKYQITGGLWRGRPFTRLVTWGRQYSAVCRYITKNFKEVVGFVKYTPRANQSYRFIEKWASTA